MDPFAWPPRAGGGLPHLSAANGGNGGDLFGNGGPDPHGSQQQQREQQLQSFQHAALLNGGQGSSSAASFSSGPSPYPSPLVPGERSSASGSTLALGNGSGPSTLPPVREDVPFTSPPLSSGGMASMADSRLGSAGGGGGGFRPSNGGSSNGFGDLVASAFGPGSIGDIWGNGSSGLATPYDPVFSAGGSGGGGSGQVGPPPSTASLIAARPYTANAASALVFMSQSGSADGPHGSTAPNGSRGPEAMGSPVFAADAMLQQVTQGASGTYAELPSSGINDQSYGRPGSSHAAGASYAQQLTPGGRPMSAQCDPQQFAYAAAAAYPQMTSRTSFAMENLSLQSLSSGGSDQAFASPYLQQQQQQSQSHRMAPNYHQAPAQALQFSTAPPLAGRRSSISQQSARPTSQGGPDRRPLHQQQQNLQQGTGSSFTNGGGLAYIPGYGGSSQPHGRSASVAHRAAHPYSRPAHNSMSAASTAATLGGWNGGIDGAGADFAQLYQHQAGLRPQTSDGVPLSYYGAEWGVPAAAVFGPSAGIQPSSYAPTGMYGSNRAPPAAGSSRPSTSYAAQAPSMLDPPGSARQQQQQQQLPAFADPRELQPKLASAGRPTDGSHPSIAPPSSTGLFQPKQQQQQPPAPQPPPPPPPPPATQAPGRRRANSAAVPRTAALAKPKPKAAPAPAAGGESGSEEDDGGAPAEREISAVTGRPKRPRRKFEEVERNYVCNFEQCGKAYGTLNHLNAHVLSQNHGPKRLPAEFRDLRKLWRRQRRERAAAEAGKGGKGAAKGKRKTAAPAAAGKGRKSSAEGAPEGQEVAMNSASDDEDGANGADHGRRESIVSQASATGGGGGAEDDDNDDDASSADEDDDDGPLAGTTSTPGLNGSTGADGRRFSSPAFVSAGPTPPTFSGQAGNGSASGGSSLGYGHAYYNLDIPSFAGGSMGVAGQPALAVAGSGPSPFADWSFAGSLGGNAGTGSSAPTTLPPGNGGVPTGAPSHPLHGQAYLAPTPGLYDAVSLDFGPGPPSEPSTSTAGTPRLGHY